MPYKDPEVRKAKSREYTKKWQQSEKGQERKDKLRETGFHKGKFAKLSEEEKEAFRAKRRTQEFRDSMNGRTDKYRSERWEMVALMSARAASSRRGHPKPEITEAWITEQYKRQEFRCYWTGMKLVPSNEPRGLYRPSLDRLDASIGYTESNTVITCWALNAARGSHTVETFSKWIDDLRGAFE